MHKTAFIITDVRLASGHSQPTPSQLRKAAGQAINVSWKTQGKCDDTDFETFSIGNRQYRFIQGNFRTNSEQFHHQDPREWPQMSHHIMSEGQPPELDDQALNAIPLEILQNSWNTTHNLVTLALQNTAARGASHPTRGLIYPDLLLNTDRILDHCVGYPNLDVFGKPPSSEGPNADFAEKYLPAEQRPHAFHLACEPIHRLEKARFQAEYLRYLMRYNYHIVLEADWNM